MLLLHQVVRRVMVLVMAQLVVVLVVPVAHAAAHHRPAHAAHALRQRADLLLLQQAADFTIKNTLAPRLSTNHIQESIYGFKKPNFVVKIG